MIFSHRGFHLSGEALESGWTGGESPATLYIYAYTPYLVNGRLGTPLLSLAPSSHMPPNPGLFALQEQEIDGADQTHGPGTEPILVAW